MGLARELRWEETVSLVAPGIRADGVHVWPFDVSFPVSVTFQVFGQQQPVRMNRHDYFELVYVLSGKITCQVTDRSFVMKRGELVVIGPSVYHRMLRHTRAPARMAALFFMPEAICEAGHDGDEPEFLMPFYLQGSTFPHVVRAGTGIPAEVFELIKRIHSTLPAATPLARLSVRTYLRMSLILLVNHYSGYLASRQIDNRKQEAAHRISPLFGFVETHFGQAITVHDAADFLGISRPHFMRLFKRVTGQSFIAYLTHFRIAKAQALLASSEMPLAQVSQEVGFCDQSYFGSIFRKIVRMTPLAYRRHFANSLADSHVHPITPPRRNAHS